MIKRALRWGGVLLTWSVLAGCSASAPSKPTLAAYEPSTVAVDGVLHRDPSGAFVVALDRAMDLPDASAGHDSPNVAERGIRTVQLVGDPKAWTAFDGQAVHVQGTLSHAANVHQSADILMTVQRIVPASNAH